MPPGLVLRASDTPLRRASVSAGFEMGEILGIAFCRGSKIVGPPAGIAVSDLSPDCVGKRIGGTVGVGVVAVLGMVGRVGADRFVLTAA